MPPKVITITNQKGGTGKTTLTALLGYALFNLGHSVLLIDLDPQAHLSSFFRKIEDIEVVENGVFELIGGQAYSIYKIAVQGDKHLGLISSGLNYIIRTYRGQIPHTDPFALYSAISREPAINRQYDFILCDTPPELFAPTLWGLYAADYIILPTLNEELSYAGIKLFLKEVFPGIVDTSKKEAKVLGIIFNNVKKGVGKGLLKRGEAFERDVMKKLSHNVKERIYEKPFFDIKIYRYAQLRDLVYRLRRKDIPIKRVMRRYASIRDNAIALAREILDRMNYFKGYGGV